MTDNIAPDYCGQRQPHAAHSWETPPIYGSASFIVSHQCAGLSVVVEPGLCWHDSGIGLSDRDTWRCELKAGHLGAHECERNGGTAVWPADLPTQTTPPSREGETEGDPR